MGTGTQLKHPCDRLRDYKRLRGRVVRVGIVLKGALSKVTWEVKADFDWLLSKVYQLPHFLSTSTKCNLINKTLHTNLQLAIDPTLTTLYPLFIVNF